MNFPCTLEGIFFVGGPAYEVLGKLTICLLPACCAGFWGFLSGFSTRNSWELRDFYRSCFIHPAGVMFSSWEFFPVASLFFSSFSFSGTKNSALNSTLFPSVLFVVVHCYSFYSVFWDISNIASSNLSSKFLIFCTCTFNFQELWSVGHLTFA